MRFKGGRWSLSTSDESGERKLGRSIVTHIYETACLLVAECVHERLVVHILGSGFVGRSFLALGNVASVR